MEKEICPYCGKPLGADGNCYNQDCAWHDPVSQYDAAEIEQAADKNKNDTCADYVINIGNSWLKLEPVDSACTKTEAITKAKKTGARCQEVVYSPADDQNYPDKVVWRNRSVIYKCCHYCGRSVCEIPVYQECDGKDCHCPEFKDVYDKEVQ